MSPTYASQYPVLRSFPLLVGYAAGVGAWGGVVLSMAALTCAIHWMVSVWINARYAFVAAMLVVLRFGLFSMWVNSYWGGAFTALGGALLLGGYAILRSRPTVMAGGLLGLGGLILMTTRPYEGLFFAAPLGGALVVRLLRSNAEARKSLLAPGAAAAALVVLGFGLTIADNLATTGTWTDTTYAVFNRTYGQPPALMPINWERRSSPAARYHSIQLRRDNDTQWYERRNSFKSIAAAEYFRFRNYWNFYVGFALAPPFALGLWALRREPPVLLSAAGLAFALSLGSFDFAHYAAPGFGFVILAVMLGFRSLRAWKPNDGLLGLALSRTLPLALLFGAAIPLSSALFGMPRFPLTVDTNFTAAACCWMTPRSLHVAVGNEVQRTSGRNLILVDTGPKAPANEVLVANEPSVDDATSIWVNDDPEYNLATVERYRGRRIWRLGWLDDGSPCLQQVEIGSTPGGAALSGRFAKVPEDPERGWVVAPPGQCPGGLTRPPGPVSAVN